MQTPKTRTGSSEVPQKVSSRSARQLRPSTLDINSASSLNQADKISKDKNRSPKVTELRSPRSPAPERKRPSRISELESQILRLQEELQKGRDQLSFSESCKKQAQQDAEESKEKLLAISVKLENSQQKILELSATEKARVIELQKITEEHDSAWQPRLKAAMHEIQQLKVQLELVTSCENAQTQHAVSAAVELLNLKQNLAQSLSLVDNMKNQLKDCKESCQAQALVSETLLQLEVAKRTVEFLRANAAKAVDGYNSTASELDHSRSHVKSLEALVSKLEADLISNKCSHSESVAGDHYFEQEPDQIEAEIHDLKSEIGQLRSALESAETKYQEEQIRSMVQIRNAYELIEQLKSESSKRESELEAELNGKKAGIEELKANLMDKETELQGLVEENENLNLKLEKIMSSQREHELKKELKRLGECVAELKADLMDKETSLQSISEENEMLKLEINKRFTQGGKVREEVVAEMEAAKAAESEAVMKLRIVMEEADRSNWKAARVAEQLEVAQAAKSEMEAELRRLKIQTNQWRKAAEAAAAMVSAGNNGKLTERSLSLDNNYNPLKGKFVPYSEDIDDDFQRKKNGNMLKKIGVLWKKPEK